MTSIWFSSSWSWLRPTEPIVIFFFLIYLQLLIYKNLSRWVQVPICLNISLELYFLEHFLQFRYVFYWSENKISSQEHLRSNFYCDTNTSCITVFLNIHSFWNVVKLAFSYFLFLHTFGFIFINLNQSRQGFSLHGRIQMNGKDF